MHCLLWISRQAVICCCQSEYLYVCACVVYYCDLVHGLPDVNSIKEKFQILLGVPPLLFQHMIMESVTCYDGRLKWILHNSDYQYSTWKFLVLLSFHRKLGVGGVTKSIFFSHKQSYIKQQHLNIAPIKTFFVIQSMSARKHRYRRPTVSLKEYYTN